MVPRDRATRARAAADRCRQDDLTPISLAWLDAFGTVHAQYLTPTVAIVGISAGTLIGLSVGDALLIPVTEVGSMAASLGWLAACASLFAVEKRGRLRLLAASGALVSLLLVFMKLLPIVPGHFSGAEWIALAAWLVLGLACHRSARRA